MTDEPVDHSPEEFALTLRPMRRDDYDDLKRIMDQVYRTVSGAWLRPEYEALLSRFPEGQICIDDGGRVVAAALAIIVDYGRWGDRHTYSQICGDGRFDTHDPKGDVLYGIDVMVDPEYRDMRLGRRLYDARKEMCRNLNLRAIVAGGRIPGYADHADKITPDRYIELVKRKELRDPVLSFQLANDFHVRRVITGYLPSDDDSRAFATLLQWDNIYYEDKPPPLVGATKRSARVGTVQWLMRRVGSLDELLQQAEVYVDALAGYRCDFALFPELFMTPLLGIFDQGDPAEAMRGLADYTERLVDALSHFAVSYNINIVGGSMPLYENQALYNVSYLLRRDGSVATQYKLHVTPDEKSWWGFRGGDRLRAIETDVGKVGVLICYDAEFPELARLLAQEDVQILFVPYWTDTKNGYSRVRRCAQARAVENECYVAITGSVGNLPGIENADIQYSQTAVFSPADFAFPHDAIVAEGTPNTEMTLIVDLDLDKLTELRNEGAVRNFLDRRRDLYRVEWLGPQPV